MRRLIPWVAAVFVALVLWPTVCVSTEGGPTTCQSAVLLPLPWGDNADSWGIAVALGAALVTYIILHKLLRRRPKTP
jgi:hypothetical protein